MAAVAMIATGVTFGRVWLNKPVQENRADSLDNNNSDDSNGDIGEWNPLMNIEDGTVIDPEETNFAFPELILNGLRENAVHAEWTSWEGFNPTWTHFTKLRVAGVLDSGTYGQVMVAYDDDKRQVAVKKINKDILDFRGPHFIRREIEIMSSMRHPNLMPILATFWNVSDVNIVMPRARFGSVKSLLHRNDCWLEEAIVAKIVTCAARGLAYMHDNGVVHRDIKPQNLVITKWKPNLVVQICDFGEAERRGTGEHNGFYGGTPGYCSPEYIARGEYGPYIDMWSLGCTLYELLFGYLPFAQDDAGRVPLDFEDRDLSNGARDLIKRLLGCNPEQRLDANGVLGHYWILSHNRRTHGR